MSNNILSNFQTVIGKALAFIAGIPPITATGNNIDLRLSVLSNNHISINRKLYISVPIDQDEHIEDICRQVVRSEAHESVLNNIHKYHYGQNNPFCNSINIDPNIDQFVSNNVYNYMHQVQSLILGINVRCLFINYHNLYYVDYNGHFSIIQKNILRIEYIPQLFYTYIMQCNNSDVYIIVPTQPNSIITYYKRLN